MDLPRAKGSEVAPPKGSGMALDLGSATAQAKGSAMGWALVLVLVLVRVLDPARDSVLERAGPPPHRQGADHRPVCPSRMRADRTCRRPRREPSMPR